eukprot:3877799-Rhodomonas_salina.2
MKKTRLESRRSLRTATAELHGKGCVAQCLCESRQHASTADGDSVGLKRLVMLDQDMSGSITSLDRSGPIQAWAEQERGLTPAGPATFALDVVLCGWERSAAHADLENATSSINGRERCHGRGWMIWNMQEGWMVWSMEEDGCCGACKRMDGVEHEDVGRRWSGPWVRATRSACPAHVCCLSSGSLRTCRGTRSA